MTDDMFEPPTLPDGAIPLHAVIVVGFLDANGDKSYGTFIRGRSSWGDLVAALEMGKDDVLEERRKNFRE